MRLRLGYTFPSRRLEGVLPRRRRSGCTFPSRRSEDTLSDTLPSVAPSTCWQESDVSASAGPFLRLMARKAASCMEKPSLQMQDPNFLPIRRLSALGALQDSRFLASCTELGAQRYRNTRFLPSSNPRPRSADAFPQNSRSDLRQDSGCGSLGARRSSAHPRVLTPCARRASPSPRPDSRRALKGRGIVWAETRRHAWGAARSTCGIASP